MVVQAAAVAAAVQVAAHVHRLEHLRVEEQKDRRSAVAAELGAQLRAPGAPLTTCVASVEPAASAAVAAAALVGGMGALMVAEIALGSTNRATFHPGRWQGRRTATGAAQLQQLRTGHRLQHRLEAAA